MKIYVKIALLSTFSPLVLVFNVDFIIYIDVTSITASNTAMMTSQISSGIEYLIQSYNILCSFYTKRHEKSSLTDGF